MNLKVESGSRARVLVLDDNPLDGRLASAVLEKLGCEVVVCRGVWEAASYLERYPVDIIVTDLYLERGSFHELHRMMTSFRQSDPPYKKVVVVSAGWSYAEKSAFFQYGELFSSFVMKGEHAGPYMDCVVNEHVLAAAVRNALEELGLTALSCA